MSTISRPEVEHLARLARIDMTDEELDRMAGQLGAVLDAVQQVASVVSDDVPATSHPVPLTNVTRPDVVRPGLSAEDALAAAPEAEDGRFRVPQILEEDA
ncbi:Asp-tRNA(Asn)/Glu-tRNA(Gln) amidotransferase subunit GatC [Paenibacillus sp. TRM 82003]|uniref:Asp-tRNA(Asn)/Glu-tRNA(Gln) amidotransferase subunit GatC n=1 Tax=Kineococcus sp. TRM81007 TaxID=2925831 RepID=UPI001F57E427|nr:Asp-tRNA(Asn)/Glu-tRNA(Gln) amidotransferase subunit GatC [Kineococcus sp. TRM81007]MCI2239353.1 Asp-tRNA(Asn)/Glu-tRNA(Gln) amidotransferase subunit GatC [Kineococcus sp. TRM81007]MCI3925037.1 Asp-tRNA(Asn)/Glu-tRNA(Gln) amidotransferase subunit GatC [Paenibacillus sp. TRM 82003]